MNKKVCFIRSSRDNEYRAIISPLPDWEDFDTLIKYLEVNYQIKILLSADGPDARRWIIEINGVSIEVIHSDHYGNYLLATSSTASEEIVNMIGEDLEKRLKDIS